MTKQDLNTINIKGKEYVPVAERIKYFNDNYDNGSIVTDLISEVDSENIVIKATVYPNGDNQNVRFTGYSQATVGDGYINKTSALENAETSAVGRALGMMGIGITDSVASSDEVVKATTMEKKTRTGMSDKECSNPDCTVGGKLPERVLEYSMDKYGKPLCYKCQQDVK